MAAGTIAGVASAVATAGVAAMAAAWPGGCQPGGGTNALLGSDGPVDTAVATTTGATSAIGAAACAGGGSGCACGAGAGADSTGGEVPGAPNAVGVPVLPGSAAAGRPGIPGTAEVRVSGFGSFALASFSAASRATRASRALASRSAASFSAASLCAFWPPLAATIDPICGVVPRVSSVAAMPCSYCRPGLAEGNAPDAATWRSAPGRALPPVAGAPPPNQPQPASSAKVDTPSRPSHRPSPIMSFDLGIAVYPCSNPQPPMMCSGGRE